MPQTVDLGPQGRFDFPDDASLEEIQQFVDQNFPKPNSTFLERQAPLKAAARQAIPPIAEAAEAAAFKAVEPTGQVFTPNPFQPDQKMPPGVRFMRGGVMTVPPPAMAPSDVMEQARATPLYQWAENLKKGAEEAYPISATEAQGITTKAAGLLGGFLPFMATGPAAPVFMAFQGLGQTLESEYQRGLDDGLTHDQAAQAAMDKAKTAGAVQTAIFSILPEPLRKLGDKFVDKVASEAMARFLAKRVASAGTGAVLGATSGGAQAAIEGKPILPAAAESAAGLGMGMGLMPYGKTAQEEALLGPPEALASSRVNTANARAQAWANTFGAGGPPAETAIVRPEARVLPTQPYVPPEPGPLTPILSPEQEASARRQDELAQQIETLQRMIVTETNPLAVRGLMQKLTMVRMAYEGEQKKGLYAPGIRNIGESEGTQLPRTEARQPIPENIPEVRTPESVEADAGNRPVAVPPQGPPVGPPPVETPPPVDLFPEEPKAPVAAPATFKGIQQGVTKKGVPDTELWNLTADIPGHSAGSTVSRKTLEDLGYTVPPAPETKAPVPETVPPVSDVTPAPVKNLKGTYLRDFPVGTKVVRNGEVTTIIKQKKKSTMIGTAGDPTGVELSWSADSGDWSLHTPPPEEKPATPPVTEEPVPGLTPMVSTARIPPSGLETEYRWRAIAQHPGNEQGGFLSVSEFGKTEQQAEQRARDSFYKQWKERAVKQPEKWAGATGEAPPPDKQTALEHAYSFWLPNVEKSIDAILNGKKDPHDARVVHQGPIILGRLANFAELGDAERWKLEHPAVSKVSSEALQSSIFGANTDWNVIRDEARHYAPFVKEIRADLEALRRGEPTPSSKKEAAQQPAPTPEPTPEPAPAPAAGLPKGWTKEDIAHLYDEVAKGRKILVASNDLGIPTIHDEPLQNAEHKGYGMFVKKGPDWEVAFDAGGAMARTPSEHGYTVLSEKSGTYPYDFEAVKARLKELLGEKPEEKPAAAPVAEPPKKFTDVLNDADKQRLADLQARLRKKFGQTNIGPDPEIVIIGAEMAGLYVKAGVKHFAAFAKQIKDDLPDIWEKIKPHLKSIWESAAIENKDLDEPSRADVAKVFEGLDKAEAPRPPPGVHPDEAAIVRIGQELSKGPLTRDAVNRIVQETHGAGLAGGAIDAKHMMDLVETAVNRWILASGINGRDVTPEHARTDILALKKFMERIPTQTTRTEEQTKMQQFSTPPAQAYAVNWVGRTSPQDVVLEPSAGPGGIAAFAKGAGARVIANELSERRLELLKRSGSADIILNLNAEHLNALLAPKIASGELPRPTLVLMNPPFSNAAKTDRSNTLVGAKHIEQALDLLAPGGRLVGIVGEGMAHDRAMFLGWWKKIEAKYNVRANIGISGDEYRKYGTSFDNQIIVIDKTGPTPEAGPITGKVDKIEDLVPLLEGVRNDRPRAEQAPTQPSRPPEVTQPWPGPEPRAPGAAPAGGPGPKRPGDGGSEPGGGATVGFPSDPPSRVPHGGAGELPGPAEGSEPAPEPNSRPGQLQSDGKQVERIETERRADGKDMTLVGSDGLFAVYTPAKVKVPGSKPHPTELVESASMASVPPTDPTYRPRIPMELLKSGALSEPQFENVLYAGQAHQLILPNGERQGYFIGDGTGVGKTREIAAIFLDNMNQGRPNGIWMSKAKELINDAKGDLVGLGMDPTLLFSPGAGKDVIDPKQKGIAFISYKSLADINPGVDEHTGAPNRTEEMNRMQALYNWLGSDFDGVIAFDEVHKAGNAISTPGTFGMKDPSQTGMAVVDIQKIFPKARILYVSATGATDVTNLSYADRLGIWGPGKPFATKIDFFNRIQAGGLSAMEIVARDLKALGNYLARTLSFRGVDQESLVHHLTPEQKVLYNEISDGWQMVFANMDRAMAGSGSANNGRARGAANGRFFASQQDFYNQLLTALQMPTVIKNIRADLDSGKSVVLQLTRTNEASQTRELAKVGEKLKTLDDLDLSPADILLGYVDRSFPTDLYEPVQDGQGNVTWRPVLDDEGNAVEDPAALELKRETLARLSLLKIPTNPLDQLLEAFGTENVAEFTGRTKRVVWGKNEETGKREKVVEPRKPAMRIEETKDFNAGKRRILVFSDAGGTGFSYHAGVNYKNQQRRAHYLIQAGWRADGALQGMGRTHRADEVIPPIYKLVSTDLKGHMRFISTIARRLGQLGALTAGERKGVGSGVFTEDMNLENQYASAALHQLLVESNRGALDTELGHGFHELSRRLGFVRTVIDPRTGEEQQINTLIDPRTGSLNVSRLPDVPQFLNRILALKYDDQNKLFGLFADRIKTRVDVAKQAGTYDPGTQERRAMAIRVKSDEVAYTHPSGAKTRLMGVEVDEPIKRATWASVQQLRPDQWVRNTESGHVYGFLDGPNVTDNDTGEVYSTFRRIGIRGHDLVRRDNVRYADELRPDRSIRHRKNYEKLDADAAGPMWNAQYDKTPDRQTREENYIVGAFLPIWDRIQMDRPRIYRLKTDKGNFLGAFVPEALLPGIRRRLGATAGAAVTPRQAFSGLTVGDERYELANGWVLKKSKVLNETRIEAVGLSFADRKEWKDFIGGYTEQIAWKERFFLPTDEEHGVPALEKILAKSPIVLPDDQQALARGGPPLAQGISEATARTAIKQDMGGKVPQNVTFVTDPSADFKARASLTPGEAPSVLINLAKLDTPEAVQDALREELIHGVWEHPSVADARAKIEALVKDTDVALQIVEGYAKGVAPEEAANQIVRELYAKHSESGLFKRAINQVVLAVKRLFGIDLSDEQAALHIVNQALKNLPGLAAGERQSLARTPAEYEKQKTFDEAAVAARGVAAHSDIARMKEEIAGNMDLSERARRLIGQQRSSQMRDLAIGESNSIENYAQARDWAKTQSPHIEWNVTKDALHSLGYQQKRSIDLEKEYLKRKAKIESPRFIQQVATLLKREKVADVQAEKDNTFRNIISVKVQDLMNQISKAKTEDARTDQLRQDMASIKRLTEFTAAVSQKMDQIVSKVYPRYWEMNRSSKSGQEYVQLYEAVRRGEGDPLVNAQERSLVNIAAEVLGANRAMSDRLYWLEKTRREPDFAPLIESTSKAFAERLQKDPAKAIVELMQRTGTQAARAAEAKAALLSLQEKTLRQLTDFHDHEQAFLADSRLRNSPQWRALINQVNADAGAIGIPEVLRKKISEGSYNTFTGDIAENDPYGKLHEIKLGFTTDDTAKAQAKLNDYLQQIQKWLYNPENADHPDRAFWERQFDFMDAVYNTAGVLDPGSVRTLGSRFFRRSWDMPQFLFLQSKVPAVKVLQTAFENWHRVFVIGQQWSNDTAVPIVRAIIHAMDAHKMNPNLDGTDRYRDEIFNSLAWAYRHNKALQPGDKVFGQTITKADIEVLKKMGGALNNLMTKVKNLGAERVMPEDMLFDKWAANTFAIRRPKEFGAERGTTVPREISQTRGKALATEMKDAKTNPERLAVLNDYFDSYVLRWMGERSSDYSEETPFEPLFKQIIDAVNRGDPDAPKSVEEVADFINRNTGGEFEKDAIQDFLIGAMAREAGKMWKNFYKPDIENAAAQVRTIRATRETPFTTSFEKDQGSSFWYDYGMVNAGEVRSTAIDSGMFHLERLDRALTAAANSLSEALGKLTKYPENSLGRREFLAKQKDLYEAGKDFRDFEDLQMHLHEIKAFHDRLPNFTGEGVAKYEGLTTIYRLTTNNVLQTLSGLVTLARVFFGSTIKQALVLSAFERFQAVAYVKAGFAMLNSFSRMAVLGPTYFAGRRVGLLPPLKEQMSGWAEELFRANKYFDQQYAYGLGFKNHTLDAVSNNLRMPVTHGAGYSARLSQNRGLALIQRGAFRALSGYESIIEPIKTIFPTLGYAVAYDSVARQTYWTIRALEARARRTFNTYEKTGNLGRFDFDNPASPQNKLSPKEMFGDGILPATETQKSLTREFFKRGTDVDLNDQMIRFFKKLQETPKADRNSIHLLSADAKTPESASKLETDRAGALASIGLYDVHHASPANRAWFLRSNVGGRLALPLAGWSIQSTRQWFALVGQAAGDARLRPYVLTMMTGLSVLGLLGIQMLAGDFEKRMYSWLKWLAFNEVDPVKHLGEGRDAEENAKIAISNTFSYIPALENLIDLATNERSNRKAQIESIFLVDKIKSLMNYVNGVVHTGDPTYGLANIARRDAPWMKPLVNRTPGQEGLIEEHNVRNIIQKYADEDLLRAPDQGGPNVPTPTPLTPIKEALANAIYKGDSEGVRDNYYALIAKAAEMGKPDPEKVAQQMLRSLNPYSMALAEHPTDLQRLDILSKLTDRDRQILLNGETNFLAASQMLGVGSEMVKQEAGNVPRASEGPGLASQTSGLGGGGAAGGAGGLPLIGGGGGRAGRGVGTGGLRRVRVAARGVTGLGRGRRLGYVKGRLTAPSRHMSRSTPAGTPHRRRLTRA